MPTNKWRYIGTTGKATIHVDYNTKKTKIVTERYIYIHDGIYPFQDPDYTKKYRKR